MGFWSRGAHGSGSTDLTRATDAGGEVPLPEMTDAALLDAVAGRITRMRLGVPAVFFLESSKPLSFVGSQVLIFLQPFVEAFLTIRSYQRFAHLMEDRKNLELLIQRIEALDEEQRVQEKQAQQAEKQRRAEAKARHRAAAARPGTDAVASDRNDGDKA